MQQICSIGVFFFTFGLSHQFQANLSAGSISVSVSTHTIVGGALKASSTPKEETETTQDKIMNNNNSELNEDVRNSGLFSKLMQISAVVVLAGTLAGRHCRSEASVRLLRTAW